MNIVNRFNNVSVYGSIFFLIFMTKMFDILITNVRKLFNNKKFIMFLLKS